MANLSVRLVRCPFDSIYRYIVVLIPDYYNTKANHNASEFLSQVSILFSTLSINPLNNWK